MKTEKQLRNEQMFKASKVAYRYYQTEKEFVVSEHDTPTVFFYANLYTIANIVMMKESDTIPKRIKKQFEQGFMNVTKECCNSFIENGDESILHAGMMTYAVISRDIRVMLEKEQEVE